MICQFVSTEDFDMDYYAVACKALERGELYEYMRGDDGYIIPTPSFVPSVAIHEVDVVLNRGIYGIYQSDPVIKELYENTLSRMLEETDYDVYMVITYILSQLYREKHNTAPFQIDAMKLVKRLQQIIPERKESIKKGVYFPDGMIHQGVWEEIERVKVVFQEDYSIKLF